MHSLVLFVFFPPKQSSLFCFGNKHAELSKIIIVKKNTQQLYSSILFLWSFVFGQSSVDNSANFDWGNWTLENAEIQIFYIIYTLMIFLWPKMHIFNSSKWSKINDRKKQKTEFIHNMFNVLWALFLLPYLLKCKLLFGRVLDHISKSTIWNLIISFTLPLLFSFPPWLPFKHSSNFRHEISFIRHYAVVGIFGKC